MISIIIVGYNSLKDLPDCLNSIYKSIYKDFRVIFVDNDSKDGSIDYVQRNFVDVICIGNKNTGYAGGNNIGIKKAIELGSDYLFLLNPDTVMDRECLSNLMLNADSRTILQPLILLNIDNKNTDMVNTTGGHLNFLGFSYCNDYKVDKSTVKEKEIALASGAAVLIPLNIIQIIGMFDESFFMYHEDVDLSWRARSHGYNIKLIPSAFIWHKYAFSKNSSKFFYVEKNRLLFLSKNFNLRYHLAILPILLITELFILLYSFVGGWGTQKLKSYLAVFHDLPSIHRTYGGTQISAMPESLKQYLSPQLKFTEVSNILFSPYNNILCAYWFIAKKII